MGIPVSAILDEHEALMNSVNGIAERFREVFQRHFWEPFVTKGMPAEEMPSLIMAVSQLPELATSVVTVEPHEPFVAFAEQYLARAAESVPNEPTANNPGSSPQSAENRNTLTKRSTDCWGVLRQIAVGVRARGFERGDSSCSASYDGRHGPLRSCRDDRGRSRAPRTHTTACLANQPAPGGVIFEIR